MKADLSIHPTAFAVFFIAQITEKKMDKEQKELLDWANALFAGKEYAPQDNEWHDLWKRSLAANSQKGKVIGGILPVVEEIEHTRKIPFLQFYLEEATAELTDFEWLMVMNFIIKLTKHSVNFDEALEQLTSAV